MRFCASGCRQRGALTMLDSFTVDGGGRPTTSFPANVPFYVLK
jgi:hypothetical protein